MSKDMKRVDFDLREDAREKFRHQMLLQDYTELQQETEAKRNNLMAMKQKKLMLEAEVRFLRKRRQFLLENKSSTPPEQVLVKPQPTQLKKTKKGEKEAVPIEKQQILRKPPPAQKKVARRTMQSNGVDLNLEDSLFGVKEQSVQRAITNQRIRIRINGPKVPPYHNLNLKDNLKEQSVQRATANQRVRINGPKVHPYHKLNLKDNLFSAQEPMAGTRKPVIDLNQISREEQLQEPPLQGFIRNGVNGQSIRRKFGEASGLGSSGQPAKRKKISWQDPVASGV